MRYGASTFIRTSPFSNRTLDLIDHVEAIGFDIIEICVEDPETIDPPAIREAGLAYRDRCIDFARALGRPFVSGPMYAAVGNTRLLDESARREQLGQSDVSGILLPN